MAIPTGSLSTLNRADGSATYSANGYTVIGAVNGPIEVQRRDELPEEATIEVNIRPAVGVGSTRERHLETILHATLRRVIFTHAFPRSLVQLTLQIIASPEQRQQSAAGGPGSSDLLVLPALLQTTILTLLSSSLPLDCTFTSVALAIPRGKRGGGGAVVELDRKSSAIAESIHVFAFTSGGQLLVAESEGAFAVEAWEAAHDRARELCCGAGGEAQGDAMQVEGAGDMQQWLRRTALRQVEKEQAWKR